MRATDFIYDDVQLSSLGYMIGYIDGAGDLEAVDTDSQKTFGSLTLFGGKWQPVTVATYKDALRFTFSVIKDPCVFGDLIEISLEDIRYFKRWLNRPEFHKLRIVDDEYEGIFWNGSANVKEIHNSGVCVGFEVTFYTDRPFALEDDIMWKGTAQADEQIKLIDTSDEIGYIYPDMKIEVLSAGDLTIQNSRDEKHTLVANCVANEIITFNKVLQINSSIQSHKLADDFNWFFPRISNGYEDTENIFTFSLPCNYEITYNPIVKAVIA